MRLPRNVIALSVVSFLTDVSSEMIYPLLPLFLSSVLGAGAMAIGAIEGAAESVAALLKLASGWWSDRMPRRKPIVVAGYGLASLARPLIGLAQGVGQVLALRLTDRVGKGIRTAPRDALIADAVEPAHRGRAFGVHRAADHAGAVVGPLIAFLLLRGFHVELRAVFLLAAVPAVLAMIALVGGVREATRAPAGQAAATAANMATGRLDRRFGAYLAVLLLFTLGNSTDAFLLLRAGQLGVPAALVPVLWALLHVVKSAANAWGGALSDRVGRTRLIVGGWMVYALVYVGFGLSSSAWQAWALFAVYGIYFGLTEGVEKALVTDLVPATMRGRAFGWYNLVLGVGALPAALLFGFIWDARGATSAFAFGALMSGVAALLLPLALRMRAAPTR